MNNDKQNRFKKVAAKRVEAILKKLDLLGNCSNRNNYDYTEEEVKKMITAIRESLKNMEMKYNSELNKNKNNRFKF